jgi:RNA polymerase sigma-70 factor (ECF subfamily)
VRATLAGPEDAEQLESTLVSRCVAGEGAAWRSLHREYYPIALAFLRKLGVDAEELDDACQDVFVQVFRNLSKFRQEALFRTWLYRLCASEARRRRRRVRLLQSLYRVLHVSDALPKASLPELSDAEAQRRVERALSQMNDGERLVFVLYELEGLPGKEIAEIAECPEATVWRRLHYARKTFRASIERAWEKV